MRFSKWLSDRFNPLREFSPMRGERGTNGSRVQVMETHPFMSAVIKGKLRRAREEEEEKTEEGDSKEANSVNHWIK